MKCTNCGAESIADEKFCYVCGAELPQEAVVAEGVVETKDPGKVFGLISMILGIVGLALSVICCTYGAYLASPMGIAAIVLGVIGNTKSRSAGFENKQGKLGLILGVVAIVVGVVMSICGALLSLLPALMEM